MGEAAAEDPAIADASAADGDDPLAVYGVSACGAGGLVEKLHAAGAASRFNVQPPTAAGGRFSEDDFAVELIIREVICPAGQAARLQRAYRGSLAYFGVACASCPLAAQCTSAQGGRTVYVGPYEERLACARARPHDPVLTAGYRAT